MKIKIVLIGPVKSGKTTIANFLSDAIDYNIDDYRATKGVRILEFEIVNKNIEVELWDCSGDDNFKNVWPVFLWNANGVVLVYNPDDNEQLIDLDRFYEHFVTKSMIPQSNTLIIANSREANLKPASPEFSGPMSKVAYIKTNVIESGENLRTAFDNFVASLMTEGRDYGQDDFGLLSLPM